MNKKKYKRLLFTSVMAFTFSSMSFLLIPLSDFNGTTFQRISAYLVGAVFWIGFLVGILLTTILGTIRRKAKYKKYSLPGIMCFFKNKRSKVIDYSMIISILLCIFAKILLAENVWVWMILLSNSVFFIYVHSIMNGNNYAYAVQRG